MSTYLKKQYKNIVIYSCDEQTTNPTFCPICGFAMRNIEDRFSYSSYNCCNSCENKWVYKDLNAWKNGVKPTIDEINLYINEKLDIELDTRLKI